MKFLSRASTLLLTLQSIWLVLYGWLISLSTTGSGGRQRFRHDGPGHQSSSAGNFLARLVRHLEAEHFNHDIMIPMIDIYEPSRLNFPERIDGTARFLRNRSRIYEKNWGPGSQ